ncbi:hypothetical protein [Paraburkholderia youngii]|uniref:UvrD-like helicase C-terminal domain-containing protein n=1 Tax=Paraburkholderia youngii TaxID=2782701 RepID=A0A7W8L2N0_9BURK|nr:hypothetical protein [Paraburkholderia youngii]MBB5398141.1 hypothetical protein [Paraburkholderia youngii]
MIATVHCAKGLEWKRVKVAHEFRLGGADGRPMPDEDDLLTPSSSEDIYPIFTCTTDFF